MIDKIESISGLKDKIDVIAVTLQLGGGFNRIKSIDLPNKPNWVNKATKLNASRLVSKFRRHHTKSAVCLTYDMAILELDDGKWVLSTSTNPAIVIKHSSTNVTDKKGTSYNIPDNVVNVYIIETTYEFTNKKGKEPIHKYFVDKSTWKSNLDLNLTNEYFSLYNDERIHSEIKETKISVINVK